jgi:hypothetical protein
LEAVEVSISTLSAAKALSPIPKNNVAQSAAAEHFVKIFDLVIFTIPPFGYQHFESRFDYNSLQLLTHNCQKINR